MNFNMQTVQNSASFFDNSTGAFVVVDSFDNREFEVRAGTLSETKKIGTIIAFSDEELNRKLTEMTKLYV